jgi:hypothetical protein
MQADSQVRARYLAYRWFRSEHLDATHSEGWSFALTHWEEFLAEGGEASASLAEAAASLPEPVVRGPHDAPRFAVSHPNGTR